MTVGVIKKGLFMGNKSLKRRIAGLENIIAEHLIKIVNELARVNPNIGLINH